MRSRTIKMIDKLVQQPNSLSKLERYEVKHNVIAEKTDCFNDDDFKLILYSSVDELSRKLSHPIIHINSKIKTNTFTHSEKKIILNVLRAMKG